jgi:hypothetical protein
MVLKERRYKRMNKIHLAHDKFQWLAFARKAMELQVSKIVGN